MDPTFYGLPRLTNVTLRVSMEGYIEDNRLKSWQTECFVIFDTKSDTILAK